MSLRLAYRRFAQATTPPERALFDLADVKTTLDTLDQVRHLHVPYDRLIYTQNGPQNEATCITCQLPFPCQTRQITK